MLRSKVRAGRKLSAILMAAIAFGALSLLAGDGNNAAASQLPRGFTEQYIHTLKQVIEADRQAYEQMRIVANRLERFYAHYGHFPDTDEERQAFQEWVSKYISYNPYQPEIIDQIEHKRVSTPYMVPILWRKDESLVEQDFDRLLSKPDPSWSADPGTIYILTNGQNIFLMWTASADRLPMRHLSTPDQKPRMICREITRD